MDKKGRKKLVELAVNGDTDAFSKLYGEIYKELYYYALANLQNAEDAADAVQDAVLDGYMSICGKAKLSIAGCSKFWSPRSNKNKRNTPKDALTSIILMKATQ